MLCEMINDSMDNIQTVFMLFMDHVLFFKWTQHWMIFDDFISYMIVMYFSHPISAELFCISLGRTLLNIMVFD